MNFLFSATLSEAKERSELRLPEEILEGENAECYANQKLKCSFDISPPTIERVTNGHFVYRHELSIMRHIERIRSARTGQKWEVNNNFSVGPTKKAFSTSLSFCRSSSVSPRSSKMFGCT
ncbi:unnamed protein product [Enterobius vermicularis]|uniref:Uncharacterized protein n=1 Tax=Enterobius vermicularis TaxID=51028 RepID=A0A0N4V002_ENTVE|nr:unnamed protein product [Enterobius vermicularis]